ncbi:helix-turn-helix transcriptional regulator [Bradyrhizobium sp. 61]|nr:helix-turn-helix transcriptional regulator [Bradyrhizobium sp. 61]
MQAVTPRSWRKAQGLSLGAAAALCGVSGKNPARTWQRWETGEREPSIKAVAAVEKASRGEIKAGTWNVIRQSFLSEQKTSSLDSTTAHDVESSQRPTPDTELSPLADQCPGADAREASRGVSSSSEQSSIATEKSGAE